MEFKKNGGFSLVEMLIVIAIVAIISGIAAYSWQRYVTNTSLRTATRDIVTDIDRYRGISTSENRMYLIAFIPATDSYYIIYSPANATHSMVFITKMMSTYGNGVQINSANYVDSWSSNWIMFQPRGTVTAGTATLTNSRASTATITSNITGKSYVQFAMQ